MLEDADEKESKMKWDEKEEQKNGETKGGRQDWKGKVSVGSEKTKKKKTKRKQRGRERESE